MIVTHASIISGSHLHENDIATIVVNLCFHIHSVAGAGMYENIYETILEHELKKRGLSVKRQVKLGFEWDSLRFEEVGRADLIVADKLLLELKSQEELHRAAFKQILTYLRITNLRLGLLLNFGEPLMKDGIHRIVNGL